MTRFKADLILLLVALVWGSAFAAQRVAAGYLDAFTFNGLRFLLAGLILAPFAYRGGRGAAQSPARAGKHSLWLPVLAGGLLFAAGGLQQAGLAETTAGNAGFITGLYVVFVPFLLSLFWKERMTWVVWAAAGLAVAGGLLLSTGGALRFNRGDLLELIGAVAWALHVIVVGRATSRMEVLKFSAGQFLTAGGLNLALSLVLGASWNGLAVAWWTVVYVALFSTTLGYTLQVVGQKVAPPTDASILLSMEAVFAALFGWLFLHEALSGQQLLGCTLILAAILLTQVGGAWADRKKPAEGVDKRSSERPGGNLMEDD